MEHVTSRRAYALAIAMITALLLVFAAHLMTAGAKPAGAALTIPQKAEQIALSKRGDPYVYGAAGPNAFDCSGLVQYSYAHAGLKLPRTTTYQWYVGKRIWHSYNLRVGDIVFLSRHHDSIYVGNHYVVVAPHTGERVQIQYMYAFYGARRVA